MLYLLLIACSTPNGPAAPETPAAQSAHAILEAGESARRLEELSEQLATDARSQLENLSSPAQAHRSLQDQLQGIDAEIASIKKSLGEATKALEQSEILR